MIYIEARPSDNTGSTHNATKVVSSTYLMPNEMVGKGVATASLSRDEWGEGKQRSSYVARGDSAGHWVSTS